MRPICVTLPQPSLQELDFAGASGAIFAQLPVGILFAASRIRRGGRAKQSSGSVGDGWSAARFAGPGGRSSPGPVVFRIDVKHGPNRPRRIRRADVEERIEATRALLERARHVVEESRRVVDTSRAIRRELDEALQRSRRPRRPGSR